MLSSRLAVLSVLLSCSAFAQNLRVLTVPVVATDPTVPHAAYNGRATTFKAIARGGNGTYLYEWDFQGDGVYDFNATTSNRYNLSTRFTYPSQATSRTFIARVRVTSAGQTVVGTYPVRVFSEVPLNPSNASDRQLQVMRDVAVDDGLWWLHNQLTRSGNEDDALSGAQATGTIGGNTTLTAGLALEALGQAQRYPAFPAAYLGAMADPVDNAARWATDPYAEDAMRLVNYLLTQAQVVAVTPADESNATGFFPERTATPIQGTDDGIGVYIGSNPSDQTTGYCSAALRGLARARLTGYVAQVGDFSRVLGRPFEHVVQQVVDGLVWAQNDSGSYPGSWYYNPNGVSDMLAEYAGGFADAVDALWVAEQAMGQVGVVVPNFVKSRAAHYVRLNTENCPQGGTGGTYQTSFNGACDFAMSAAHLFTYGWVGANAMTTTDARAAFPGSSSNFPGATITRGQLRAGYNSSLVFINNTFVSGAPTSTIGWDMGLVFEGDFTRVDGQGDHWSMFRWARAARASTPEVTRYGTNDWWRQFSSYFIRNQLADGSVAWTFSGSLASHNDTIVGAVGRQAWALLTLLPSKLAPVAWASASATTAPEGTEIELVAGASLKGTVTWSLGDGRTLSGATVRVSYPDDGVFTVTATVTTSDGVPASDSLELTITNAAPSVDAGADVTVDEGTPVPFTPTVSDPGTSDTLTFAWTFLDGGTASTRDAQHTWPDDGVFTAELRATDDDGASSLDLAQVTVRNVAPVITSRPTTLATVGAAWTYTLTFTDPGTADTHSCSLTSPPAGAALTGCTVSWTPTRAGNASFTVCVTDDDGGRSCETFVVTAADVDTDGDGLSDAWETATFGGLAQTASGDPDADGVSNRDELIAGTNANVFDGPTAPSATACNATVTQARPTLTVTNATDPQATPLRYEFQLYADAALTDLVVAAADVTAGATSTSWRVPVVLDEDARYYWRARAHDAAAAGPWTTPACAFLVDAVNALPGAPTLDAPARGARVATLQPQLTVGNATDPEGDALTYEFELLANGQRVGGQQGVAAGTGSTSWQTPALQEDTRYTWRARAVSAGGAGPWSELGDFQVNAANTAPPSPVLVTPQQGTTVAARSPELVFLAVVDADGDAVTYDWEVAADERFATALVSGADVTTTRLAVTPPLDEDSRACWRVRADDGQAQSPWVHACFRVSESNDAPNVPTAGNPSDGSTVASRSPVFSWAPAVDPEGAPVSYDVELSADGAVVATLTGVSGTAALFPEPLTDGQNYGWRVRATTSEGPASGYSAPSSFRVSLPEVVAPKSGCTSAPGALWLVGAALLALRRRRR